MNQANENTNAENDVFQHKKVPKLRLIHSLLTVKDSSEQSGVNTIESLQGFHPLLIGEFWPPFVRAMLFQLS